MQRKQIWYMVYQVTNPGKALRSVEVPEDKLYRLYKLEEVDKPVRFIPVFTLEVHNQLRKEVEGSAKVMVEQYIPIVLPAIRPREDRIASFLLRRKCLSRSCAWGETVWGVATWQTWTPTMFGSRSMLRA